MTIYIYDFYIGKFYIGRIDHVNKPAKSGEKHGRKH